MAYADVTLGKVGTNFAIAGKNVKSSGENTPPKVTDPCSGKFLPMR